MSYKVCCNLDRVFDSTSVSSSVSSVVIVLPACVKMNRIFFFKVGQAVPSSSLPVYLSVGGIVGQLLDSNGTAVEASTMAQDGVYLAARVCGSVVTYRLINFVQSTPAGVSEAILEDRVTSSTEVIEPETPKKESKGIVGKLATGVASLVGAGAVAMGV